MHAAQLLLHREGELGIITMNAPAEAWLTRNATQPAGWDALSFGRELGGTSLLALGSPTTKTGGNR